MNQTSLTKNVLYQEISRDRKRQTLRLFPLLKRYANFIIKDKTIVTKLVTQVLEDQYEIDRLMPSPHLRQVLLTDTRNRCICYMQLQIFDRSVIKVPVRKYHSSKQNSGRLQITAL